MPAPQRIKELVDKFAANFDYHQSSGYNEEQLRHEFLNPFFEALGWDMENKAGKGAERDVHYEKRIKAGAPDFGFYLDSKRRFFVEAKNPSRRVCNDQTAALQLRTYGWSAKVPRSILTDFEELAIYDTTVRLKAADDARVARLRCIKYTEYVERWDEIAALFSREAVAAGSLEKLEKKRARQAVDDDLLEDISRWREALAKNIALRNTSLSEEQVNRAVQNTLDRIIFLRICEDRGIETENRLGEAAEGEGIYDKLFRLFRKAKQRYDSDLFEVPSAPDLEIDDKVLTEVISELYFPKSPYEFDVIPADILGQVYEQFLGKVIRLTAGHHAKIEDKPEVRRAGGVYYTPTYIVDYIVRNTVGRLVDGKNPKDIATLSVVDPACGSGSFLIGAYQYLMDWYRDWYVAHTPDKFVGKTIYRDRADQWQLTLAERRRILTAHIYGVDIDPQAVEVAKLSLMLKALEATEQQNLLNDRMLPDLSSNIKCGNSLIASDFSMVSEDLVRVHAFDWPVQFAPIMKAGGFDVVIGNPPYVLIGQEIFDEQTIKYLRHYEVAQYKADLFHLFIQKGISLTRENGLFGMIVPNTWLTLKFTDRLRHYIVEKTAISEVVMFDYLVFEDANVFTALLFLEKKQFAPSHKVAIRKVAEKDLVRGIAEVPANDILQSAWNASEGYIFETRLTGAAGKLVAQLINNFPTLESVARASLGCQAYNSFKHTKEQIDNRVFHAKYKKGKDYLPELAGNDVGRYEINRERGQWIKYGPWLHDYRTMDWLEGPRILIREISGSKSHSILGAYVEETYCHYKTILNVNPSDKTTFSMKYLLSILNSRLISFLYPFVSNKLVAQAFPRLSVGDVKRLPIAAVDTKDPADKARHDELVGLVDKMLGLMSKLRLATVESDRATLQNAVTSTDQLIDQLVYKLYGLTDEEIRIVEEGTK